VVITDVKMPIMTGLEMAKLIKEEYPRIKVILTTAHSDTSYLLDAIAQGVDAYVIKPVEFDKLYAAIDSCIETILVQRALRKEQEDKDQLLKELKAALAEVRTLRGIIPICSCCKKIRDDKGFWDRVENYVAKHSYAKFSHSFCPECFEAEMKKFGDP